MKVRNILTAAIVAPLLAAMALAVYLKSSDLSEWRPFAARIVSRLIHRRIVLEGAFSVRLGELITVKAENVRLDNPSWASTPWMARADSVSLTIDSRSLFSRPVRFVSSSVKGARLHLEKSPQGVGNWEFRKKGPKRVGKRKPFPVAMEEIALSQAEMLYFDRSSNLQPVRVELKEGEIRRLADRTYRLEKVQATWGTNLLRLHGVLAVRSDLIGTDLTVEGSGPDVSPLAAFTKVLLPAGPYSIGGRVERSEAGFRFNQFSFRSGGYRLSLQGHLGNFPRFNGTDFHFQAEGPSLAVVSHLVRLPRLPDERFEVAGTLRGDPERFRSERFNVRMGGSDLRGSFNLDLKKNPPYLSFDLRSNRVDLTWLSPKPTPPPKVEKKKGKGALLLSDQPLNFEILKKLDGRFQFHSGTILTKSFQTQHVAIDLRLKGGALHIARAEGSRGEGEIAKAEFTLEPAGGAYHVLAKVHGEKIRLAALGGPEDKVPHLDLELAYDGTGKSLRELALQGNGAFHAIASAGVVKTKLDDIFTKDLLKTIAGALNPFRKEKTDTKLECGVIVAHLGKGEAKLDAVAMRTDTTTLAGDGKVKLEKEQLDFEWAAKPRKGIGLSASSLTEPYIKLGGTLSEPRLKIEAVSAGVSTGLAVVTFGLSILAKGVWNRVSAENDVCMGVRKRFGLWPTHDGS